MASAQLENEMNAIVHTFREPKSVLSAEKPSELMAKKNEDLMEYLQQVEEFSKIEEAEAEKDKVVRDFTEIVDEWIKEVNRRGEHEGVAKVVLYGSKASKTSLKSDDIDILVVTQRYVDRKEDFFGALFNTLKKHPKASCLLAITKAIVPIIKCDFEEHRLDIGFVTVDFDLRKVDPSSEEVLANDHLLLAMDENMIRSFNAFRNAHLVYRSVVKGMAGDLLPEDQRLQHYRTTLLCVKLWAKRMGVYGSMLGYFGGISLAIMVAKICQLYPNMLPAKLIEKFFFIYQMFPWNEIPVLVEHIEVKEGLDYLTKGKGYFKKEDLALNKNNKRLLLVISPAFPQMNATYNVSESQQKIIDNYFREAYKVIRLIEKNELEWEDLFLPYPFFHDFDNFLEVEILSKDEESFHRWKGLIQARLRYLLLNFELENEDKMTFQLWPQEFNLYLTHQQEFKFACLYYIGVKSQVNYTERLDLSNVVKPWKKSVYEQWEGDPNDNRLYTMSKKRNELDQFVYNPIPKGIVKYEGKREIFPPEKEQSNLLSRLRPENQLYMSNQMGLLFNQLPGAPAQPPLPPLYGYMPFSPQPPNMLSTPEAFPNPDQSGGKPTVNGAPK